MDEENFDDQSFGSPILGRYDAGNPFGESVRELQRCGICKGLYISEEMNLIMGMYMAPIGQEAIKRRKKADDHNRKLDELFNSSKKCYCQGRNGLSDWLRKPTGVNKQNLCNKCSGPLSICVACDGSGFQEAHDPGTFINPYPCLRCSSWNGDPDDTEHWDSVNKTWIPGSGVSCETEGCTGSKGLDNSAQD
jgi:hypothetical protein